MSKIATFAFTDTTGAAPVVRRAEVTHLRDWDEYKVKFFRDGMHLAAADYFTGGQGPDHVKDALATARSFVFPPVTARVEVAA